MEPFAEGNVSPDKLLAADFSPLSNTFEPGASQGLEVSISPVNWRISVAVTDGLRTGFAEVLTPLAADVALTGHVEVSVLEQGWGRFQDFTSFRGSDSAIRFGLGAHYQTGGRTGRSADLDLVYLAGDAQFEGNGWNGFIQGVFSRRTYGDEFEDFAGEIFNDWGGLAQAGVFVANPVELFAQGSVVYTDGQNRPENPDVETPPWFRSVVGGLNFYPFTGSHFAKLTGDFQYMFDPLVGSTVPISINSGMLPSFAGDQWAVRVQWVMSF